MWGSSEGLSHYDYGLDDSLTLFLPSGLGIRGSALRISKPGVLKNASDLAFQEYTCLTHQPERWQDEPLDKTMQEIILFFQLGFEKGIYNLFD